MVAIVARPPRSRVWLYSLASYARFDQGERIEPDWLWPRAKFLEWIRAGAMSLVAGSEPVVEMTNEEAVSNGCVWFQFLLSHSDVPVRIYALLPEGFAEFVAGEVGVKIERPERAGP